MFLELIFSIFFISIIITYNIYYHNPSFEPFPKQFLEIQKKKNMFPSIRMLILLFFSFLCLLEKNKSNKYILTHLHSFCNYQRLF